MNKYLFLIFLIIFSGCFKDEEVSLKWDKLELLSMGRKGDENLEIIFPLDNADVVYCSQYFPPCKNNFKIKVKNLVFIALEYDDEKSAQMAAKKIKAYYSRNWVFDDVNNEPVLENFVLKYIQDSKKYSN